MSSIEYNSLLLKISRRLGELNVRDLVFLCRGKIAPGNEHNIHDVLSLFRKLEDQNNLGVDRLEHLKEILKAVKEWTLFKEVKKFEIKRKEYNDLLQQISRVLDESNDLERLISICRGKTSEESEGNIHDVRTLFKELENQDNLGIGRLDVLKEILNTIEKEDLVKEVEKFERRRDEEDAVEIRKAQTAAIVASARSVGGTIMGVLNVKTVCKVAAAGITLVTVKDILTRWSTYDQLVHCFNSCVVPAGTQLIEIGQGCVCFTVRADSLTALVTLWNMYQDGTLRERLHTFLVTEEMLNVAGGEENVDVTVIIEEDEYEKACFEFIHEAEDRGGRTRRTSRRNSDSALSVTRKVDEAFLMEVRQLENRCKLQQERIEVLEKEMEKLPQLFMETGSPEQTTETSKDQDVGGVDWTYLDPSKKAYVQKYVDNLMETTSTMTGTSESGVGSSVAPSESGLDEILDPDVSGVDLAYLDPFKIAIVQSLTEKTKTSDSDVGLSVVPSPSQGIIKKTPPPPGQAASVAGASTQLDVDKLTEKFGSGLATEEHTTLQAQRNGGPRPPKRPDYGTVGRPIKLRANFFRLNISPQLTDLYRYDVEITPNKCPKTVKRDVVKEIIKQYRSTTFQGHSPAFDGEKNLYSRVELPAPVSG